MQPRIRATCFPKPCTAQQIFPRIVYRPETFFQNHVKMHQKSENIDQKPPKTHPNITSKSTKSHKPSTENQQNKQRTIAKSQQKIYQHPPTIIQTSQTIEQKSHQTHNQPTNSFQNPAKNCQTTNQQSPNIN